MATEKARETGLAGRYANAVFELAQDANKVDVVAGDFAALKAMIDALAARPGPASVKSPVVSGDEKAKASEGPAGRRMGASSLTSQFILTLVAKRRLFALTPRHHRRLWPADGAATRRSVGPT